MTRCVVIFVVLITGCSLDRSGLRTPGEPGRDAETPTRDGSLADATTSFDAGRMDAGLRDAAPSDAGVRDTGAPDTGLPDTGLPDTGLPDTGVCLPETCDATDEDCDGQVDEGGVCGCPALSRGGHHYLFCNDMGRSWSAARAWCMARGYDLAILNDSAEDRWVWMNTSRDDTWIGLHDMGMEARYEWVDGTVIWSGGTARGFTNWRGGVPEDVGSQDCSQMDGDLSDGQWADHPCSDGLPYVCETRSP